MSSTTRPVNEISLVFRNQGHRFFSIERVFGLVMPFLEKQYAMRFTYLPFAGASPVVMLRNILFLRRQRAAIYHVTGDIHYAVMGLPGSKTILTVHDCVFLHRSHGIKRQLLLWLFLKWPVRRAGFVTTISEATKAEIIRHTHCAPEKITVIPNAADEKIKPFNKSFNTENPVLLFIGITPNKNMERVIEAVRGTAWRLRIIGQPNHLQQRLLESSGIAYSAVAGLTDAEMAEAYSACDMVIFPSLYEGFGMPVLEGQMAGRPVITSNISPLKEVGGSGACLVDPLSVASIREGIEKVITDVAYRERLIEEGFHNVKQYTAANIAGLYLALYRQILQN